MIEIKNLSKSFGTTEVLKGLDLTIPDGSIFGLVGINGSGKSTLLRMLAGVYRADSGSIRIDGEEIYNNEHKKKEIFFLPDDPFYEQGTTGLKLAELYRTFYDFDDATFRRYIDIYKLNAKMPIRNFSKGMKRQMFVALAFAISPKYLFLDEVFDGLDPLARLNFKRGLIESMEKTGGTVILSSHSLRELEDICDSYGLIDGHAISSSGNIDSSTEKVYKFQLVFDRTVSKEEFGFDMMSFEQSERVVRIVVSGDKEEYLRRISEMKPIIVDELPVDFEELFVSRVSGGEAFK